MPEKIIKWKFEIGQHIYDETRDFIITNRKEGYRNNGHYIRLYQIHCNKCGFDSGEYYRGGVYHKEWWVGEFDINRVDYRGKNKPLKCPCCSKCITVPGINDISTQAKWMIPFFKDKEDQFKYVPSSPIKVKMVCPHCNTEKELKCFDLYHPHTLKCKCKDSTSLPNRVAYSIFKVLEKEGRIESYIDEYKPSWCTDSGYRFDNYFIVDKKEYLIEIDSNLGHGRDTYCNGVNTDVIGKERDKQKDLLAKQHGISLIRIDCPDLYEVDYYKECITKVLSSIIDFSNLDWNEINYQIAYVNKNKIISDMYTSGMSIKEISRKTTKAEAYIKEKLRFGQKYGWVKKPIIEDHRQNYYWENYFQEKRRT